MQSLSEKQRRDVIVDYYLRHPGTSLSQVAAYFKELGIAQRTVYDIINRYDERQTTERASGSGRPPEKINNADKARICNAAILHSKSQRQIASTFGISQPYVHAILSSNGIHAFKKEKVPYVTEGQKERQGQRCKSLRRLILRQGSPDIVMDDESYFSLRHDLIPSNAYYYANARGDAPPEYKTCPVKRFETKLMMWIAISPRGISRPYFVPSAVAVNKEIYMKECIQKKLYPFLQEKYPDSDYIFWPDLASSHTAKTTVGLLQELDINFVSKEDNPPCVPQLRPIENFFGILKQQVYKNGWEAQSHDQLKGRIKYCLAHKISENSVCELATSTVERIKNFIRDDSH